MKGSPAPYAGLSDLVLLLGTDITYGKADLQKSVVNSITVIVFHPTHIVIDTLLLGLE